mgnify:CR=1 FL=1
MNEFEDAIKNSKLSSKSITTYGYVYKRLIGLLKNDVLEYTEKQIIKKIKQFDISSAMSKNSMLAVVMLIRKNVNEPTDDLVAYSKSLIDLHYKNKQKSNETLQDDLPSVKQLQDFTNGLYADEKYTDYIINYILLNYNTRNMDLDLKLLSNKKDADENGNYIYSTNKYLLFVRNNYKTSSEYGTKKIKIYNANMRRAFKILLGDATEHNLIETSNLNKYIQDRTYDGIGEGRYTKVVLSQYKSDGSIAGFEKVSKNRGTSISVLLSSYNLDTKQ